MKRRFATTAIVAALSLAAPALADGLNPHGSFTFKRVKPPSGGTGKRITVQIDPAARLAAAPPKAAEAEDEATVPAIPAAPAVLEWYWSEVSPKLEDSQPGRLAKAVTHLGNAPAGEGVAAPRLQLMQDIASAHGAEILAATIGTDVSPALVLAVIGIESSGRTDALSGAGASGLMQLMPATAERFGVTDATVAAQNIKGGVAYLNWLMKEFDRDPIMVLAGYNAGENAVKSHEGVPPFAETRAYVPKVLAAWAVARGLCLTPPELITDGCVFAVKRIASDG